MPAFPVWAAVQAPIHNHDFFKRLAAESIEVPGPEVQQLCEAAREHGILVSIGISERSPVSVGCLWNSNLLIGADGAMLNHHRKLMPTFYEKLVWASGDGAGLRVHDTPIGKIGMLICGENTNPLARYSLIAQGEQVHVSSYPPVWPTRPRTSPAAMISRPRSEFAPARIRSKARCSTSCRRRFSTNRRSMHCRALARTARETLEQSPQAVSMVIGPSGEVISDTLCESEGLLYQDIDIAQCVEPKQFHDVVGYYNRFDVFDLKVTRKRLSPIQLLDVAAAPADNLSEDQAD